MEVDFEFQLAGETYRVVRKWTAPRGRTGSGTSLLELSRPGRRVFRSISGNTIRETDAKIVELLRMSYTTFTNSAFILQGRADAFTTRTPAERKQVLSDILELGEYDRLQERARDEVRRRESRHRELSDRVREADAELRPAPHLRGRARPPGSRDRRAGRAPPARRRRPPAASGGGDPPRRPRARACRGRPARQPGPDRGQSAAAARSPSTRRRSRQLRVTLDNADQIEQGAADLARTRQADESLNRKRDELTPLAEERSSLTNAITTARTRLEADVRAQQQHIARHEKDAAQVQQHEQALAKAHADQGQLVVIQARQAEVEQALGDRREEAAELRGANEGLRRRCTTSGRRSPPSRPSRSARSVAASLTRPAAPA